MIRDSTDMPICLDFSYSILKTFQVLRKGKLWDAAQDFFILFLPKTDNLYCVLELYMVVEEDIQAKNNK